MTQTTDTVQTRPALSYDKTDFIAAFAILLFGIEFVNLLQYERGLFTSVFCILFVIGALLYTKARLGKLNAAAWVGAVAITALAPSFFLFDNNVIKGWGVFFLCIAVPYWFLRIFGCRPNAQIESLSGFDLLKALLIIPFANFVRIFPSVFNSKKEVRGGKKIFYVLLGLAIALIPAVIVLSLLIEADGAFKNLTDILFKDFGDVVVSYILPLIFGVPVAMYIFGMAFGTSKNPLPTVLKEESCRKAAKRMHFVPTLAVCTSMIPLILIYLLFFFSQTGYFLSAFSSIVPEGLSTAEYAVNGFFEICGVSAVNAVLIFLLSVFGKQKEDGTTATAVRILNTVFSVLTLALIATAMSKLVLYIRTYGLTIKRVCATWFTVILAIIFILLIVKQIAKKFNFVRAAVITFCAMFFVLTYVNPDAITAKHNVDRYLADPTQRLDVSMISNDLSGSAYPFLEKAYETADDTLKAEISNAFVKYVSEDSDFVKDFRAFNLSRYYTEKQAERLGFKAFCRGIYVTVEDDNKLTYSLGWSAKNASGVISSADGEPLPSGKTFFEELPVNTSFVTVFLYGKSGNVLMEKDLRLSEEGLAYIRVSDDYIYQSYTD